EKVFAALRERRADARPFDVQSSMLEVDSRFALPPAGTSAAKSFGGSTNPDLIKIVGFDKDITLSIGEAKGLFAEENLGISFDQTLNSTGEILGLLEGKWDIAFDNGDNVVAWDEGQGADGKTHDLFIFLGGSQELNQSLFVTSEIHQISDLK